MYNWDILSHSLGFCLFRLIVSLRVIYYSCGGLKIGSQHSRGSSTICNSSPRGSKALFWPLQAPPCRWQASTHPRAHISINKCEYLLRRGREGEKYQLGICEQNWGQIWRWSYKGPDTPELWPLACGAKDVCLSYGCWFIFPNGGPPTSTGTSNCRITHFSQEKMLPPCWLMASYWITFSPMQKENLFSSFSGSFMLVFLVSFSESSSILVY